MKQLALEISSPRAPALDNFVPGRNAELIIALYAFAHRACDERFIYLWGNPGSGRSHLLQAVAAAAREHGMLTVEFAQDERVEDESEDALILADDVHLLNASAQVRLFDLHNRVTAATGSLLMVGDSPPALLKVRPDLRTRIAAGLIYRVHALTEEERMSAMHHHAANCGFDLPRELASYILQHVPRDMTSLLAAVNALDRYSLESRRTISLSLVREVCATLVANAEHPSAPAMKVDR